MVLIFIRLVPTTPQDGLILYQTAKNVSNEKKQHNFREKQATLHA